MSQQVPCSKDGGAGGLRVGEGSVSINFRSRNAQMDPDVCDEETQPTSGDREIQVICQVPSAAT